MKTISKEKAWFGIDENCKYYCFEKRNDNYIPAQFYNYYFKFLSDITVNENNEINCFNDQPLIYKDGLNRLCKEWFINGESKRSNPEKPRLIIKGLCYYFNDEKKIDIKIFKDNLR